MLKVMISCVKRTDSHKEEKVSPPLHNIYNIVTSLVATLHITCAGDVFFLKVKNSLKVCIQTKRSHFKKLAILLKHMDLFSHPPTGMFHSTLYNTPLWLKNHGG